MDKYRLVEEHIADDDKETDKNNTDDSTMNCEVRITQQGKPRNYISYAMKLFVRADKLNRIDDLFRELLFRVLFPEDFLQLLYCSSLTVPICLPCVSYQIQ